MKKLRLLITRISALCLTLCLITSGAITVSAAEADMNAVLDRLAVSFGISESDYANYSANYAASLPAEYVQDDSSHYVALGGTTAGGLAVVNFEDCYADLFAAAHDIQYTNCGENGLTSTGAVSYVGRYTSDISAADLITFQLDGASFISTCMSNALEGTAVVWDGYVTDSELLSYINSFKSRIVTEYGPKYGKVNAEKISAVLEYILYECVVYCIETTNAANEIRRHNSDAVILVLGLYNPLRGLVFSADDGSRLDVGDMVEQMISFCNVFLLDRTLSMAKTHFIDLSATETDGYEVISIDTDNETKLTNELYGIVSKASSQYANVNGHRHIYELMEGALAEECPHSSTVVKNTREASCTAEGYTGDKLCATCGIIIESGKAVPVKEHSFGQWSVTVAPSCTARGEETRSCTSCGKTETKYQSPSSHSFDDGKITREPTCDRDGIKTVTCKSCGETKTSSVPALGHSWDSGNVTREPTCDTDGEKAVTCQNCKKANVTRIPATGHVFDKGTLTVKPTCEAEGERTFSCTACGKKSTASIPAKGHTFDNGKITREPTCEAEGEKTVTCISCGKANTEAVPAKGHSFDDGKITREPTCEAEGEKAVTCKTCGKATTEAIPAKGHSFDDGKITREPTCEAEGEKAVTCKTCGKATTEAIPAKGHSFDDGKITREPTCEAEGEKILTCSTCGKVTTEAIPAKGHSFDEGNVTREPTCEAEGERAVTCTVCGIATTTAIPAKGHSFDEGTVTVVPTCEAEGERNVTCTACGTATTEKLPATGHKFEDYVSNEDATCKTNGTKTAVCVACSAVDTIEDEDSRTEDHRFADDGICTVCGFEKESSSALVPIIIVVSVIVIAGVLCAVIVILMRKKKLALEGTDDSTDEDADDTTADSTNDTNN